jgi:hypothetical protein
VKATLVHLDFQLLNNQLVLSWTNAGFNLQTAPAVTGPFTNLPAATRPVRWYCIYLGSPRCLAISHGASPYTNPLTAPRQFFRLISLTRASFFIAGNVQVS